VEAFTVREMIEALEEVAKEHGDDLPVLDAYDNSIREAIAFDADGNTRGKAVVVILRNGS
jgi:hypothetical protein